MPFQVPYDRVLSMPSDWATRAPPCAYRSIEVALVVVANGITHMHEAGHSSVDNLHKTFPVSCDEPGSVQQ